MIFEYRSSQFYLQVHVMQSTGNLWKILEFHIVPCPIASYILVLHKKYRWSDFSISVNSTCKEQVFKSIIICCYQFNSLLMSQHFCSSAFQAFPGVRSPPNYYAVASLFSLTLTSQNKQTEKTILKSQHHGQDQFPVR